MENSTRGEVVVVMGQKKSPAVSRPREQMYSQILPRRRIPQINSGLYITELSDLDSQNSKGECKMATLGAWCIALFLVWYGLAAFVPALNTDMFRKIGGVLALLGGLLSIIGLLGM
jgi:hypothetical protein